MLYWATSYLGPILKSTINSSSNLQNAQKLSQFYPAFRILALTREDLSLSKKASAEFFLKNYVSYLPLYLRLIKGYDTLEFSI